MSDREINVRRCELNVLLGRLAEQFADMKKQLIELEIQEASINRELAELALTEIHAAFPSHGGGRNGR